MPRNELAAFRTTHVAVRAKRYSSRASSVSRPSDGVIPRNEATPLIAASVRRNEILRLRSQRCDRVKVSFRGTRNLVVTPHPLAATRSSRLRLRMTPSPGQGTQNDTVFASLHSVPCHGMRVVATKEESRRLSRWDVGHEIPRLRARNDTCGVSVY